FWIWIHLVQRHQRRSGHVRREIWRIPKALEHRRRTGVELVHRWHAENLPECSQDAGRVVLSVDNCAAAGVWARAKRDGSISAHVIPAVLWIILNREDGHLRPEFRTAQSLHDPAERQIIIGHAGGGRWAAGIGAARVIIGETDNHKLWKLALLFELSQFVEDE